MRACSYTAQGFVPQGLLLISLPLFSRSLDSGALPLFLAYFGGEYDLVGTQLLPGFCKALIALVRGFKPS